MMKKMALNLKTLMMLGSIAVLTACSSTSDASLSTTPATSAQIAKKSVKFKTSGSVQQQANAKQTSQVQQKVMNVFHQWAGTRYRLGGTTKAGIDCSAFVQRVMNPLNISLPRTTSEQKNAGVSISKSELRPGDLVFFRKNRHVGVYIGNGKFVHASTSRGVMTSSMSESYWARTYTQSRRVL